MLKDFIALTKPRLLRLNIFAAFGGFWLASKWDFDFVLMLWMLVGSTLTIASATVTNNYWDRDLDQKMERTRDRALPMGKLHPNVVLIYAIVLLLLGMLVLFLLVHPLSGWLGLAGWFSYVGIYTIWLKRRSTWSTAVGGIAGAMPPVIGYCAVTGEIDAGAWLLFALLFLWQPAHFWSLGIRRVEEYREAGFPLLPVVKGIPRTKLQMIPYVFLLIPTTILLYTFGYAGIYFLIIGLISSVYWLVHTIMGLSAKDTNKWAKINFIISVNYLMVVFIALILNTTK